MSKEKTKDTNKEKNKEKTKVIEGLKIQIFSIRVEIAYIESAMLSIQNPSDELKKAHVQLKTNLQELEKKLKIAENLDE